MNRYPDSGHPLDDASILRNAIEFSTAARAFEAECVLGQPLDSALPTTVAYLTLQAYAMWVRATEDFVGWMSVLRDWQPGDVEASLLFLIDRVHVDAKSEETLAQEIEKLDLAGWRKWMHVPNDYEVMSTHQPISDGDLLSVALTGQLGSARNVLALRAKDARGRVVAYNKHKHVFTGIYRPELGDVLLVGGLRLDLGTSEHGIHLKNSVELKCSPDAIKLYAQQTVVTEAVLFAILWQVLKFRFGDEHPPPDWFERAVNSPAWIGDGPPATAG